MKRMDFDNNSFQNVSQTVVSKHISSNKKRFDFTTIFSFIYIVAITIFISWIHNLSILICILSLCVNCIIIYKLKKLKSHRNKNVGTRL